MQRISFKSRGEEDTRRLGQALARILPRQAVIALCGTLGAGKTRLVQAVTEADGIPAGRAVSPTFTLCNEYTGQRKFNHMDLYRIADEDELFELGFDEYVRSEALTFIEWADRFSEMMPADRLDIVIGLTGESQREFELVAHGPAYEAMLDELQATL